MIIFHFQNNLLYSPLELTALLFCLLKTHVPITTSSQTAQKNHLASLNVILQMNERVNATFPLESLSLEPSVPFLSAALLLGLGSSFTAHLGFAFPCASLSLCPPFPPSFPFLGFPFNAEEHIFEQFLDRWSMRKTWMSESLFYSPTLLVRLGFIDWKEFSSEIGEVFGRLFSNGRWSLLPPKASWKL